MSFNASREARVSLEVVKEVIEVANTDTQGLIPLNRPKSGGIKPKST